MVDELLHNPWWTYEPETVTSWGLAYRWFNLFEGTAWLVLAALVLHRWYRHRKSRLELAYAAAFFSFGVTDFAEANTQSAALVAGKGIILLALLSLRHHTLTRHYPSSRLY